jgi:hypothetical protein
MPLDLRGLGPPPERALQPEWGTRNEDFQDPNWHTVVDPASPLEVRAPDGVAELVDNSDDRGSSRTG